MSYPITFARSSSRVMRHKRVLGALNRFGRRYAPVLAFALVLLVWEMSCRFFQIPTYLLPSPSKIIAGFTQQSVSVWLGHTWATMRVALMGYGMALAVSIPLAIAFTASKLLSRTFYPMIVVIHS